MLGRRGVLAGALGLAALTACDVDDLRPPDDDGTPSTGSTPSSGGSSTGTDSDRDPDTVLVEGIGIAIINATMAVEWARVLPRLRRTLAPLERTHLAHLAALEQEFERPPPQRPPSYAVALREVRSAEESLQGSLVTAAVEARSGALARLLASMSASVAQHVETLP